MHNAQEYEPMHAAWRQSDHHKASRTSVDYEKHPVPVFELVSKERRHDFDANARQNVGQEHHSRAHLVAIVSVDTHVSSEMRGVQDLEVVDVHGVLLALRQEIVRGREHDHERCAIAKAEQKEAYEDEVAAVMIPEFGQESLNQTPLFGLDA